MTKQPGRLMRFLRGATATPAETEPDNLDPTDPVQAISNIYKMMAGRGAALDPDTRRAKVIEAVQNASFRINPSRGMTAIDAKGQPVTTGMDSAANTGSPTGAKSAFRLDGMSSIPEAQLLWYAGQGFPGFQTLAIIAQHWLVAKAVTMPPKDAVRNGYSVKVSGGDKERSTAILAAIKRADKRMGIKKHMVQFVRFGRIFGIRIGLYLVDTPDPATYYGNPFNIDAVRPGSYRGISQIDPYWCMPELSMQASSNPTAQDFYEPTWWTINGMRIHRSHLVIYKGEEVADVLKPSYLFGGISIVQRIANRVYAAERTADEAPALAMSKRVRTLATSLAQAVANQGDFEAAMEWRALVMNNFSTDVIDKTKDQVTYFDTSLADLDTVIMTQYQLVAAVAECPATRLLGTTPKGFNSSGDYEADSYRETLRTIQDDEMTEMLERHHALLVQSIIKPNPGKYGEVDTLELEVNWNPIDVPKAGEKADIDLKNAQTDATYIGAGVVDPEDVRTRLVAEPDSMYQGLEDHDEGI